MHLEMLRERRRLLGRRIRFREPAHVTAHWRRMDPTHWHPSDGATGTIVGWPPPDHIGAGPKIRWDYNGRESFLGSGSRYEPCLSG